MKPIEMEFQVKELPERKSELFIAYHQNFSYNAKKLAEKIKQQTTWRVFLCSGDSDLNDDEALDALRHTGTVVLLLAEEFQTSF